MQKNSSYNFISLSDLSETMKLVASEMIKEEEYVILPPLQKIKTMCLLFQKSLTDINLTEDKKKEIYVFGTQLVFTLRSFLFQSDILFTIGAISPDGQELSTTQYSQDQVLQNLVANLSTQQIQLSNQLEKFNKSSIDTYSHLWPQILNASEFDWQKNQNYKKRLYSTSTRGNRYLYQKTSADTNVWVRFYQKKKQKLMAYYYDQGNEKFLNYNKGWLYEWFQEYIQIPEQAKELTAAFYGKSNTPLQGMLSNQKRENVPGYQGGDYQLANGRFAQAKYGNRRIITFTSIKNVISNILVFIKQYESTDVNYTEKALAQDLIKTFTHKDTINQSYEDILDTLLNQLQLKKTVDLTF